MVQVKANEALSSALGPIRERAEVVNERGTVLGYFEPITDEERASYRHAASSNPDEVRENRESYGPGSTPGETLDRP